MNYFPGLASKFDPLISASHETRMTSVSHQCPASVGDFDNGLWQALQIISNITSDII
jgi:hypothetical protein